MITFDHSKYDKYIIMLLYVCGICIVAWIFLCHTYIKIPDNNKINLFCSKEMACIKCSKNNGKTCLLFLSVVFFYFFHFDPTICCMLLWRVWRIYIFVCMCTFYWCDDWSRVYWHCWKFPRKNSSVFFSSVVAFCLRLSSCTFLSFILLILVDLRGKTHNCKPANECYTVSILLATYIYSAKVQTVWTNHVNKLYDQFITKNL